MPPEPIAGPPLIQPCPGVAFSSAAAGRSTPNRESDKNPSPALHWLRMRLPAA
jgi:hypothetical protein